jgi:16S rRNA (guanine527-N7)-methyltransferase
MMPHEDQIREYLDLLLAANERMNLTRITDRAQAEILHVGDSLTLLPHLPKGRHRLADVGSGGGVPGIILAIMRPDAQIVLIESTLKKAEFLRVTADALKLSNVTVEPRRAEEMGQSIHRQSFDVVVARAVARLPVLVEWMLPLVKPGGWALAMKGPKAAEELAESGKAIKRLGGSEAQILPVELPGRDGHVIVRIHKKLHGKVR